MRLNPPTMALAFLAIASPAAAALPDLTRCNPDLTHRVDERGRGTKPRRLGELPPAQSYHAVWQLVDGCPRPVLVGERRAPRRR